MRRFDQEKMAKLVSEFRKSVSRLQKLKELGHERFLKDSDKVGSAKYNFIVAIESATDMCNHVISRNGYRVPEGYGDTFKVMHEEGAFEVEFSEELLKMAKFRNRLVHLYWEIDDDRVYRILQDHLGDFKKFLDSGRRVSAMGTERQIKKNIWKIAEKIS